MSGSSGRRPLSMVVTAVEALTLVAVLVFVVLLFANEPPDPAGVADDVAADVDDSGDGGGNDGGGNEGGGNEGGGAEVIDGAVLYAGACASCHGSDGGGGIGPALAGGAVVEAFPEVADQIALVAEGDGGMPGFAESLSPEEIEAVVLFTREGL